MRDLSDELRERLAGQPDGNSPPPPVNYFVLVEWPLDADGEETARRCYSTVAFQVMIDGNCYGADQRLLQFEDTGGGFVTSSDHYVYGASCRFHVPDGEGLVRQTVDRANERRDFPIIHCEAWMHFSEDAKEIEGMRYGVMAFGGHVTRLELRRDANSGRSAKVWGGHEGVVLAKSRPDTATTASVVGRPLSWSSRVDKLLRQAGAPV